MQDLFGFGNKKKQQPKAPPKQYTDYDKPFEVVSDVIKQGKKQVAEQVIKGTGKDVVKQLFGIGGDLKPGQEVSLAEKKKQEEKAKNANTAPAMDYAREIIDSGKKAQQRDMQMLRQSVDNLTNEIRNFSRQNGTAVQRVDQAVGGRIVNPGVYHESYLQGLWRSLKDLQGKDSGGGPLLQQKVKKGMGMGKPKKQENFWGKVKKHGTSFLMSGERTSDTGGA
jgi:polyhydroxyalkanoate synthesis regulator phasin